MTDVCLGFHFYMIVRNGTFLRKSTRKYESAVDWLVVFHSGFPFGHILHGLQDDFAEYRIGTLHNGYVINGTVGFNDEST